MNSATLAFMARPPRKRIEDQAPAVAVKVTYPKYASDAFDEIRIHEKVQAAVEGAQSPITELTETFAHGDRICLVFRLHGRDLREASRRRTLSLAEVKGITREVLKALADIHAAGLIHTDVKPANILYDPATRSARLADLGLAATHLRHGGDVGTCDYTPPEAMLGNPMSAAVDLWGLGCTVFEMLTGRLLFDPWTACERKYDEFQDDEEEGEESHQAAERPEPSEISDPDESPLRSGDILGTKYRLKLRLGDGKFAEVWSAVPLHVEPIPCPEAGDFQRKAPPKSVKKKRRRPRWDLHDISIAYEHLLQIRRAIGPVPPSQMAGKWVRLFCLPDGRPKFGERIRPRPLSERLAAELSPGEAGAAAEFLQTLLRWEPAERPSAVDALALPWLKRQAPAK